MQLLSCQQLEGIRHPAGGTHRYGSVTGPALPAGLSTVLVPSLWLATARTVYCVPAVRPVTVTVAQSSLAGRHSADAAQGVAASRSVQA